jgi:dihydrofolate synthase / folylpolyglutamate synthase
MPEFSTIDQAEAYLHRFMRLTKELTGKDVTVERMRPLVKAVDDPHKKLKIIHLAGTSGKTSTAYYIASLLKHAGKKVGLTVSPYVDSITEKIQINSQPLAEREFCEKIAEFITVIESAGIEPSYFELLIGFAYWYFAEQQVDYAVIETGLGGMHDSTNIANNPDKICVITDIGFDHMQVLGNTIQQIAAQKAGIIHAGNQVFMYEQSPEIMEQIQTRVREQRATLTCIKESYDNEPEDIIALPAFQQRNWHLAHEVVRSLEDIRLNEADIEEAMNIQVPARMDVRTIHNKTVVMDGAHNGQKMTAFIEGMESRWPQKEAAVLISLKNGKEYNDVLPQLRRITDTLIITTFAVEHDMKFVSADPELLAESARRYGIANVIVEPDQDKAYGMLMNMSQDLLVITGSFYLIGQLRKSHKELQAHA